MRISDEINIYIFEIEKKFDNKREIERELANIYSLFKRTTENNPKYADISFIMGISETDNKDARIVYEHTGRVGRPKKIVLGTKIDWHFHIYVVNYNRSPSTFCNEVKKKLSKKGYNIRLFKRDNDDNMIHYLEKQCSNTRRHGKYFT